MGSCTKLEYKCVCISYSSTECLRNYSKVAYIPEMDDREIISLG